MKLIGLTGLLLLTTMHTAFAAPIAFPGSCTATPSSVSLAPGQTANIAYQCSDTDGGNYQLTFSSTPDGVNIVSAKKFQNNPHNAVITAPNTAGTYTVNIDTLYLGAGVPFHVAKQTPVTVTVSGSPAPSSQPNFSITNSTCDNPTTIAVNAQTSCTLTFTNTSTSASAYQADATLSAQNGNVTPTSHSCGTVAPGGTCDVTFSYTAGSTEGSGSVTTTLNYQDEAKASQPAVTYTSNFKITTKPSTSSSDLKITLQNQPKDYVQENGSLPITFAYTNAADANLYYEAPEVSVVTSSGEKISLPISATPSECHTTNDESAYLPNKGACTTSITIDPSAINSKEGKTVLNVGDQIQVVAMMHFKKGTYSANDYPLYTKKTFDITIGDAPIFAEVRTNRLFINDPSKPGVFYGAFVFQNNSGAEINGKNDSNFTVQQNLPTGFKATACTSSTLAGLQLSSSFQSCDQLSYIPAYNNAVAPASCVACFEATTPSEINSDQTISAQLQYKQSSKTISKKLIATPTYRALTLKNSCTGPVWAAFVSGAAYQTCSSQSDCPLETTCVVDKKQCIPNFINTPDTSACPSSAKPGDNCSYNQQGADSGTCQAASGGGFMCIPKTFTQCPQFSSFDSTTGECFWNLPTTSDTSPGVESYTQVESAVAGGTPITFKIPNIAKNNAGYVWSGGLVGRTGCILDASNHLVCKTGDCVNGPNGDGNCKAGNGPKPPATQAEFTLQLNAQDYYDIEIIDGFNIPVTMAPTSVPSNVNKDTTYVCGKAGAINTTDSSTMCPWTFSMQDGSTGSFAPASDTYRAMHYLVTPAIAKTPANEHGGSCEPGSTPQGTCKLTTDVCGISQANVTNPLSEGTDGQQDAKPRYTCGKLLGFWSTNLLCSFNNKDQKPYYRNTELACGTDISSGYSKADWLGCNTGITKTSCYGNIKSGDNCCGCPYWGAGDGHPGSMPSAISFLTNLFSGKISVPYPNSDNNSCKSYNESWVKNILVKDLAWMKKGCPSAYTFAYDDATSTFTCNNAGDSTAAAPVNSQNYTIEFCPANHEGTVDSTPVNTTGIDNNGLSSPENKQCPCANLDDDSCKECRSPQQFSHHTPLWKRLIHDVESFLHLA